MCVFTTDILPEVNGWGASVIREERAREAYEFDAVGAESTIPTLRLSGSDSPRFLKAAIDALAGALPNSRIAVLDGQAHAPMNTPPELFVNEILAFVFESS